MEPEILHEKQLAVENFLRRVYVSSMRKMHEDLYAAAWDELDKEEKKLFKPNDFYDFSLNLLDNAEESESREGFKESLLADLFNPFSDAEIEELLNIVFPK